MKKFLSILLMLCLLLSLCACTANPQPTEPDTEPTEKVCQHNWVDATCTEAKTCSICGTKDGRAIGHSWDEGICTVCKAEDPSFDPLTNGTWLYITKQRWEILDFHPDGTCDIKTVNGETTAAKNIEDSVNKAVMELQRQYPQDWKTVAASKYYVLKIGDYYYVANMTATTAEYTTVGKNVTIEQAGLLPIYVELIDRKNLRDVITEDKYVNMEVQFISNLFRQYNKIHES